MINQEEMILQILEQGDVVLKRLPLNDNDERPEETIPVSAKKVDTNVLQEGEHTGHAHRLDLGGQFEVFQTPEKQKYLRVYAPVALRHEEHKAFKIAPGDYRIDIVREVDPFEDEIRAVAD